MKKMNFEEPTVETINFEEKDVITMSDPELPGVSAQNDNVNG